MTISFRKLQVLLGEKEEEKTEEFLNETFMKI